MNIKIPLNIYGRFEDHCKLIESVSWQLFDWDDGSFLLAKYIVLYDHTESNWDKTKDVAAFLKQELQGFYIEGVLEYLEYDEYFEYIGQDISDRMTPYVQYIEYEPDDRFGPYTMGDFLNEIVSRGGPEYLLTGNYDENYIERGFEAAFGLCSDEMVSIAAKARIVQLNELEERLKKAIRK